MPILSRIGRKSASARMLLAVMYLILIVGGITMLYPFLLMIATSVTDQTDYNEFRLIPRYFHEPEARFIKVMGEKYQQVADYSSFHPQSIDAWDQIPMPTYRGDPQPPDRPRKDRITGNDLPPRTNIDADFAGLTRRVELWRQFKASLNPLEFGAWYIGNSTMPGKTEILWRDYLRAEYHGDIDAYNRDMEKRVVAFADVFAPYEKVEGRLWPGVSGRMGEAWTQFKKTLDGRFRRPVDATILWKAYLLQKYETVEKLNKAFGTDYKDFKQVTLPATVPANEAVAAEWEYFARNETPYRFVAVADGDALYRKHLVDTLAGGQEQGAIEKINSQLDTHYKELKDIVWPPPKAATKELTAISPFLRAAGKASDLTITTPDKRYGKFLSNEFKGDMAGFNAQTQAEYTSFDDVRPPIEEEDLWEQHQDQAGWTKWFLTNNYREVVDYIAVRGRALWNTLFLVSAMVICSLTVNPLAAYALSRFKLGYTNQVLLFLLATMAFPYEVSMIPNFLLLRRFPLWSIIAAVIIGIVVALVIVRKTKGSRRVLAIPCGLGAGVIGGLYLVPFAAHLLGVDIGPVSLLNTFAALIMPEMASGFSIFLLKGFFDSLPEELFEAGRIDGASEIRMLLQLAYPLSKPILAVIALETFTYVYGSYLWALVVCQNERMWTLMVWIFQLQQWAPAYTTMAATILASIPTLLIFIFAQKTIMKGIIIPVEK